MVVESYIRIEFIYPFCVWMSVVICTAVPSGYVVDECNVVSMQSNPWNIPPLYFRLNWDLVLLSLSILKMVDI